MNLIVSFHQVRMNATTTWETTFKTNFGLFWVVGNASTTFTRLINDIFRPHLGKFIVIYLDDILVFNKSWAEHIQHVCNVLDLLRAHKLQVKENKSYFGKTSVHYFGFILDTIGFFPHPSQIQVLAQWSVPFNVHDIKSFMGDIDFYRKFVSHFSQFAHPLY